MSTQKKLVAAFVLATVVAAGVLTPPTVTTSGQFTTLAQAGASPAPQPSNTSVKPYEARAYVRETYAARFKTDMVAEGLKVHVAAAKVPTRNRALAGRVARVAWAPDAVAACGNFEVGRTITVKTYRYVSPVKYFDSGRGVERWRPAVRHELKRQGVHSKFAENKILHIMKEESGGNPKARRGQYLGLFQFGNAWASKSARLDGKWSIQRIVRVYKAGGVSELRQHWRATYY